MPFVQISKNEDKAALEACPRDARIKIFFHSASACDTAQAMLESTLVELQVEKGAKLGIAVQEVRRLTDYEPNAYGEWIGALVEPSIPSPGASWQCQATPA